MDAFKAVLTPNPMMPNNVVRIDPEKCIACYTCVGVCRSNVIVDNPNPTKPPVVLYPDECWMCACCTEDCPTGAITFDHPIIHKVTWKRKETGEIFRIGMKNHPEPSLVKSCGDHSVDLQETKVVRAIIAEKEQLTRFVTRLKLRAAEGEMPKYRGGSFCNLRINEQTHRGYSMANIWNGTDFELYIDTFSKGPGISFIGALNEGEAVELELPFGRLTYLPKKTPVLFVGSVTGISPVKALIEEAFAGAYADREMHLVFQVWEEEDAFLQDYFEGLAREHPNFTYEMVYGNAANMEAGTKSLAEAVFTYEFNSPVSDIDTYVCGSKATVKAVERILLDRGVFWGNIYYESFQK